MAASRAAGVGGATAGEVFVPVARLAALGTDLAERPLGPSLAFRTSLRTQLLDEAAARTAAVPAPRSGAEPAPEASSSRPPRASRTRSGRRVARRVGAAGLLLVVSGGGLTAAAASSALPGDPLYGVKRVTESVRLHAAHGSSPSADVQFVAHRLGEAERIAAPAATFPATPATPSPGTRWADFDRAVGDAATALGRVQVAAPDPDIVAAVGAQRDRWQALLPVIPPESRRSVQEALDLVAAITGTLPALGTAGPVGGDASRPPAPVRPGTASDGARAPRSEPTTDPAAAAPRPAAPSGGGADSDGSATGLPLPDLGSATDRGSGTSGTPGTGSESTADQSRRLSTRPDRDDIPARSSTSNSSPWDGGPRVLERTTDALTGLLSPLRDR